MYSPDRSNFTASLSNAASNRRDFLVRAGGAIVSASAISTLLTGRAIASPGAALPRYRIERIDSKTLVIADSLPGGHWVGLDPAWFYEPDPNMAMYSIYDQLYHTPDGSNPTDVRPLLASGMPELSDDLLTATIALRQGVKFHHTGNEMTADDVIFSFERLVATRSQPSFLATDYWTGIENVDDYTIRLTLPSPNAGLAALLSSIQLSVTDSKQVMAFGGTTEEPHFDDNTTEEQKASNASIIANRDAQSQINQQSVGTGPFMVDRWEPETSVVLVVNPDFWGEPPAIEQIIFTNIAEPNTQLQAVETGDADIAYALNPDSLSTVQSNPDLQVIEGRSLSIQYMAMNLHPEHGGPLADQRVRQAFAQAIDYDAIIRDILLGGAVRPALPIPIPLSGSESMQAKAYSYDPARAQQLWDAAGFGEQTIQINYDADGPGEGGVDLTTLATAVKSYLEAIEGVTISLNPLPGVQRTETYRRGEFQMTFAQWIPDFPDADAYAAPFFRTGTAVAKRVGYSNPEVDELLRQGLEATDPAKRDAIYQRIQELVLPDIPYIVLYQPSFRKPASISVQGVTVHPVYLLNLRDASKTE